MSCLTDGQVPIYQVIFAFDKQEIIIFYLEDRQEIPGKS